MIGDKLVSSTTSTKMKTVTFKERLVTVRYYETDDMIEYKRKQRQMFADRLRLLAKFFNLVESLFGKEVPPRTTRYILRLMKRRDKHVVHVLINMFKNQHISTENYEILFGYVKMLC
jgi:hypothetical protein